MRKIVGIGYVVILALAGYLAMRWTKSPLAWVLVDIILVALSAGVVFGIINLAKANILFTEVPKGTAKLVVEGGDFVRTIFGRGRFGGYRPFLWPWHLIKQPPEWARAEEDDHAVSLRVINIEDMKSKAVPAEDDIEVELVSDLATRINVPREDSAEQTELTRIEARRNEVWQRFREAENRHRDADSSLSNAKRAVDNLEFILQSLPSQAQRDCELAEQRLQAMTQQNQIDDFQERLNKTQDELGRAREEQRRAQAAYDSANRIYNDLRLQADDIEIQFREADNAAFTAAGVQTGSMHEVLDQMFFSEETNAFQRLMMARAEAEAKLIALAPAEAIMNINGDLLDWRTGGSRDGQNLELKFEKAVKQPNGTYQIEEDSREISSQVRGIIDDFVADAAEVNFTILKWKVNDAQPADPKEYSAVKRRKLQLLETAAAAAEAEVIRAKKDAEYRAFKDAFEDHPELAKWLAMKDGDGMPIILELSSGSAIPGSDNPDIAKLLKKLNEDPDFLTTVVRLAEARARCLPGGSEGAS